MEYRKLTMGGYNLHLIKTDKFKTSHVEVIFRNNVLLEELTKRQFLSKILCESNNAYPTRRKLLLKFEDLYNANIYSFTSKVGGSVITSFCADFLNPEYTDKTSVKETIKLLFDIIFYPLVNASEFDNKTFNLIKDRIKDNINLAYENPSRLSVLNALQKLGNTPSAYNSLGTLESLNEITPENLYDTYLKMIQNDYVDIFVVGSLNMDEITKYIYSYANFKVIKNHEVNMQVNNPKIKEKEYIDEFRSVQSNVVMILNLNNITNYERNYVVNVYNSILGGSSLQSKLYKKLRMENSLCYGVNSFYQKYDGLILITTGVDANAGDKAIKLIKETLKEMTKNITDEELDNAKESINTSLNYAKDDIDRIVDNYYYESLNEIDSIDERIKNYKSVTKEDIYNLSKKISISIVYTLKGGNNE